LDRDDDALWGERHAWWRVFLSIQVVKRAGTDGSSIVVALLLERMTAQGRSYCRRGVAFILFKIEDRNNLEKETFYIR
jgi:hypothetical protein